VLLDLSAAFETVDHHILLQRLEHSYGLPGLVRQWFQSNLVGRRQFVRTGSSTSSLARILCGAPQGSVLGPILLLLYTADLLLLTEGHGLWCPHLYADDTQVYGLCRPSATIELQNIISACIDDVARWMRSNQLQLQTPRFSVHPVDTSICYQCHPSEWVPTKSCQFPLSATSASTWTLMCQ